MITSIFILIIVGCWRRFCNRIVFRYIVRGPLGLNVVPRYLKYRTTPRRVPRCLLKLTFQSTSHPSVITGTRPSLFARLASAPRNFPHRFLKTRLAFFYIKLCLFGCFSMRTLWYVGIGVTLQNARVTCSLSSETRTNYKDNDKED